MTHANATHRRTPGRAALAESLRGRFIPNENAYPNRADRREIKTFTRLLGKAVAAYRLARKRRDRAAAGEALARIGHVKRARAAR